MSAEIRLGLVGCGRLAERGYVPAAALARGMRLVAVADPDESRRERLARALPEFASAAELLAEGGVDAVVLATPAEAHLADARLCTEAGVAVLVEKPPAADLAGTVELAKLEPAPFVGFQRRFDPDLARLREACPRDGQLEFELALDIERTAWSPYVVRDDALLDLAPHLVDLAAWISQSEVQGVRRSVVEPLRAELELDVGRGTAVISCAHDRSYRELAVVRSGGREVGRSERSRPMNRLVERLRGRSRFVACLAAQLEALGAASRGEDPGELATAEAGLEVMTVLEEARELAAAGPGSGGGG